MTKNKFYLSICTFVLFFILSIAFASGPIIVSNVKAIQEGNWIVVNYDLSHGGDGEIFVELEFAANGTDFTVVSPKSQRMSGDLNIVAPGEGKEISWQAAVALFGQNSDSAKVNVKADYRFIGVAGHPGVVLDKKTGFMWPQNALMSKGSSSIFDSGLRNWEQAKAWVDGMNSGIKANFGFTDWKMPSQSQFSTLHYSKDTTNGLPGHPFVNYSNGDYWTSSKVDDGYRKYNPFRNTYTHESGGELTSGYKIWAIRLGFKRDINVLSIVEYRTKDGILSPDKGYLQTSVYQKDEWITNRIKGPDAVVNQYYQVLKDVIKDILETFKKKVAPGIEVVVETSTAIAEGGAKLLAKVDSFLEEHHIFISQVIPRKRTYRIRARRTKSSENFLASTIGNVYVVNVQDVNGQNINQFSKPLELTIGFTTDLLKDGGFSPEHASHLNIYRWDGELECYRFSGGDVDIINHSVTCLIQFPGQYILAIDLTPPDISNFTLSDHSATPILTFSVKDNLSGIDISTIICEIDDIEYVTSNNYTNYLNPDTGYFSYQMIDPLESGVHAITMTVGDTSGNIQQQSYTFTVNNIPPLINEDSFIHSLSSDEPAIITALVADDETIKGVFLYYRAKANEMDYLACEMVEGDTGIYTATIPQKYCTGFGIRYYITAIDESGNETVSTISDINITDNTGPELTGDINMTVSSGQLFIQWDQSMDMDLSGYYIYRGQDMDHLELYKDIATTNYIYLESIDSDTYIGICAYDQSGNMGNQIVKRFKSPAISIIPDQTIQETTVNHLIQFTVTSGLINENLTISAMSSNLLLIHSENFFITQAGSSYNLMLTPVNDACGMSTITVIAGNQFLTNTTSFDLSVICTEEPTIIGDVNGDKMITIEDVILVLKRLVGFSL